MIGLIILDGWGISNCKKYNAIEQANIQNFRRLLEIYPNTALRANGLDVGLPEGQMGNSEVGHLNIGAGRIVYQDLTRITRDIQNGDFFKNEALVYALEKAKTEGKALHIMGLLSDGGVHSHITHLYALLEMAKRFNLPHVYIHVFLDGRDTPPANALVYIKELEEKISELNTGKIATVSGRYYAMDRDKRWERTEQAYNAIVLGEGVKADSAVKAVEASYILKETDEFVRPTVIIDSKGEPVGTVKEGDSIIFFNFRPDRARQLTKAFVDKDFEGFKRKKGYFRVYFVCMTRYDDEIRDVKVAYEPEIIKNTLGEIISRNKMKQLRIAETEKYAH
ncbi:MAG TPA: 2,3-bisphosphoglycerate-independent phosphoglycerate mutase, partial [Thermoanaerobacterales bacterium]|nr:2,3-bisphosphoglycerate-independent phosphoglycerate mutase [Thermoanaerobacterales bacterium]